MTQRALLDPLPLHAVFLQLDLPGDPWPALRALGGDLPPWALLGVGPGLIARAGLRAPALAELRPREAAGVPVPSTPVDLWLRVAGDSAAEAAARADALLARAPSARLRDRTEGFLHQGGRDLTGYEDGTENPTGADAEAAALLDHPDPALRGGSVVAVQRWVHEMTVFHRMPRAEQDASIGRERDSNDELDDAPPSAHVKRAAQEDFDPAAFVVRRSMPWRDARGEGLVFIAFGASLAPFDAQLSRMCGEHDGVVDALFRFTRPVDGLVAWLPPRGAGGGVVWAADVQQ